MSHTHDSIAEIGKNLPLTQGSLFLISTGDADYAQESNQWMTVTRQPYPDATS
jgi:hypothetical protein